MAIEIPVNFAEAVLITGILGVLTSYARTTRSEASYAVVGLSIMMTIMWAVGQLGITVMLFVYGLAGLVISIDGIL